MKKTFFSLVVFILGHAVMAQKAEVIFKDGRPAINVSTIKGHLPMEVTFLSGSGEFIFADQIHEMLNLGKAYDLKSLPRGEYVLKMTTPFNEVTQYFDLKKHDIVLNEVTQKFISVPLIDLGNGFFDVKFNSQKLAALGVVILDQSGTPVFEDNLGNVVAVNKRYHWDAISKGNYTIKVTTPDKIYYKDFIVK
jgi:hypothetical protein